MGRVRLCRLLPRQIVKVCDSMWQVIESNVSISEVYMKSYIV